MNRKALLLLHLGWKAVARPIPRAAAMQTQDFFQLPRTVQDRFTDAAARRTVPKPIISRGAPAPFPFVWAAVAALCLLGFVAVVRWGYGSLDSPFALAPLFVIALYCALLGGSAYCALQTVARYLQARRVPFPYGVFLFPSGVIDARRVNLQIHPLEELAESQVTNATLQLRFTGGASFRFEAIDANAAEIAREKLVTAKRELLEAKLTPDPDLTSFNPLLAPRYSNPLAPPKPHAPAIPKWRIFTPVLALLIGTALGSLVGFVRNTLSERKMFASAVEQNTPAAYEAYLANGGRREEVEALLLPSARFQAVKQQGSLDALEKFALDNPTSPVKAAIDLELRQALLGALNDAKQAGNFAALDRFAEAHPSSKLVHTEIQAARAALMREVLANFADNHAAKDDELVPFFEKLLQYSAANGPRVEVRFHRIVPDSVAKADEAVSRDKYFIKTMLPSQYFDDERSQVREEVIFGHLKERFTQAFNSEALTLVHGKPLSSKDEVPQRPDVPTLFISHSTNMGQGIRNVKPNGTFVGVGFVFRASFVIPDQEQNLQLKYSTWKPPDLLKLRKGQLTIANVYLTMAESAFSAWDERVVKWLFRNP